jgi:glyoxylase-like metal-dependent hydrolase (beta-lactamase superfamily II)
MAEVKILVKGYAKELKTGWLACSTSTLIRSNGNNIVFDPGCNREKLIEALKKENLKIENINFVMLSHGHMDHSMLTGMFSKAKIISFESLLYDKDLMLEFKEDVLGPETKIIQTPGHCSEHISLIVNTKNGKYAVAGDVFWWTDDETQVADIDKEDSSHPLELNMKNLKESRKKILASADFVIPGHGEVFKTKK